jgi:hypothetical protein
MSKTQIIRPNMLTEAKLKQMKLPVRVRWHYDHLPAFQDDYTHDIISVDFKKGTFIQRYVHSGFVSPLPSHFTDAGMRIYKWGVWNDTNWLEVLPQPTKYYGRLLVRKGRMAGIYMPLRDLSLKDGLWEVREINDKIELVYIGKPAMPAKLYQELSLHELLGQPSSIMTKKEWKELTSDS